MRLLSDLKFGKEYWHQQTINAANFFTDLYCEAKVMLKSYHVWYKTSKKPSNPTPVSPSPPIPLLHPLIIFTADQMLYPREQLKTVNIITKIQIGENTCV